MDEKRLAFQNKMGYNATYDAPVAQLDRASDYGSEGCKFESCRARHLIPILWVGFFMPVGLAIPPVSQSAVLRKP